MPRGARVLRKRTSKTKKETRQSVDTQDVAKVAYELFEKRGRVHGFAEKDWLEAEQILKTKRSR